MASPETIKLSVRKLTEQVLRCGDIDSRFVESAAMQNGAAAHRMIQSGMGQGYQKEVSLRMEAVSGGIPIILQGRADGVIFGLDDFTIDEIKTTTLPLEHLYEQRSLHLGQAKCYARMLLDQATEPPASITIQLTYYQLDTGMLQRHQWTHTPEEILAYFDDLLQRYGVWLQYERDWRLARDRSIADVSFPFPTYRAGQRDMLVAAYRTIQQRKKLYIQAPTGIGKTLSALFPAVKAMGEQMAEKVFYLTAKTITRTVAEDAVELMAAKGLRLKSVTLRAKDKICFQKETICTPDACPYAKGHYDRVNDALLDTLHGRDLITPAVVEEYAEKHRVCPYEMALDLAVWADLVLCDYNHVFDPRVYLKRFFSDEGAGREFVFLIDEAHNLSDRVRDMYSVTLHKSEFYRLRKDLKDKSSAAKRLRGAMDQVNTYLKDTRYELEGRSHQVDEQPSMQLLELVNLFTAAAEEWLSQEQRSGHPLHDKVLELYFNALSYQMVAELYDERYATITEINRSDVDVTLYCLDPSKVIRERLGRAVSTVFFSATLTPLDYYREILGGSEVDGVLDLPSPFDRERLLLVAHRGISVKYQDRAASIDPIAEAVYRTVSQARGNYLVYFPSYDYMGQVHDRFRQRYPHVDTLLQTSGMSEDARGDFLQRFDAENTQTLVGFCVLGGIFSEGIDLRGERLIGSVIVGVGLPRISLRQDLIRDYFDRTKGSGFNYAYVFPGMNKVLQAAGRVIRSAEDYGVVLLIDSRFSTPLYRSLYPGHWSGIRMIRDMDELEHALWEFPYFTRPDDDQS